MANLVGVRRKFSTLKQEGLDLRIVFNKILGHLGDSFHEFVDVNLKSKGHSFKSIEVLATHDLVLFLALALV